jgi:hypothetical protein
MSTLASLFDLVIPDLSPRSPTRRDHEVRLFQRYGQGLYVTNDERRR